MTVSAAVSVRVSDEVWICTALLHTEQSERPDFRVSEIIERVKQEAIVGEMRPSVPTYISEHCVAGKKPNPGNYRILTETSPGNRRLYRAGDPVHPGREEGQIMPDPYDIPARYEYLLEWYRREYAARARESGEDPLLKLRGSAQGIYGDPDEYVRGLREGWE
jgi:hypothetical protein